MNKKTFEEKNIYLVEPFYIRYMFLIFSLVLLILFTFVFSINKISEEENIVNVWVKSTTNTDKAYIDNNIEINGKFLLDFAYRQGSYIHYFNELGETIHYKSLGSEERVSVNNENYLLYKRYGRDNEAYSYKGVLLWRTNTTTYPEASPYALRIINHSSDNSRIQMLDFDNNVLSRQVQYGEFITDGAFASQSGDYIAGFTSGYIALIDRTGNVRFVISAILSEVNIVKSVAISEKGSFVSSISGIRQEYLTLYNSDGKTMWYIDTKLNRRRNVPLSVSEYSMSCYMLSERTIDIYSIANGKIIDSINIEKYDMVNAVLMKSYSTEKNTVFSLSKDGRSVVLVYDNNSKKIIFEKYISSWVYNVSISSTENEYMIVSDDNIYLYKKSKL